MTKTGFSRRIIWGAATVAIVAILLGAVSDVRSFDRTRGGYEPPYTGFTGDPIDWSTVETTTTGMLRRGWVIDFVANCTTGMIHGRILGVSIPFRPFSERAIIVHRPREACIARGFEPQF